MNPTKPRKEDRRVQRTRQLLRDALMQLIIETGDGSASFLMRVRQYLAEQTLEHVLVPIVQMQGCTPRVPLELLAYSMAGSLIGTIKWWLDNDMQPPPSEIAVLLESHTLFGLPWALGLSDAPGSVTP